MFDPKQLLDNLLGSQVPGTGTNVRDGVGKVGQMAKDNPLAAGALVAVLLGTGAGRNVAGTALKLGGIAAIGSIAYNAYQNYKNGGSPADTAAKQPELLPPPADTDFHPSQAPQGETEFALTLVRAMIAAANADGHIDETERKHIADRLSVSGMGSDAEQFLMNEIANPLQMDQLAAAAQTEAQKVELYTAVRLTIEPDSRAERGFLDLLAGRLGLPDDLIDHVEATVKWATNTVASGPAPSANPKWDTSVPQAGSVVPAPDPKWGTAPAEADKPAATSVPNVNPRW